MSMTVSGRKRAGLTLGYHMWGRLLTASRFSLFKY